MREQALSEAKQLVRHATSGVLSTISKNMAGYPFGSVTPFMLDSEGNAYFYISDIAQHSKNMAQDAKVSLTVFVAAAEGDQNENARATLVGDCHKVTNTKQKEMIKQFVTHFPESKSYEKAHDFAIWKLEVKRVRYIGGFGKIFWLEQNEWVGSSKPWTEEQELQVVEHMNEDHQVAMIDILNSMGVSVNNHIQMLSVHTEGCYIKADERLVFVTFRRECRAMDDIRVELVKLTKLARKSA